MNEVYLEQRMIHSSTSLTKDLARHLFARGKQGQVVITTENPANLHAALRKQWLTLLRQVQRERSSTLQAARILILSGQIGWMQRISFTCNTPDKLQADIYILTPQEYLKTTNSFAALYITDHIQYEPLIHKLRQGVVVTYSVRPKSTSSSTDGFS